MKTVVKFILVALLASCSGGGGEPAFPDPVYPEVPWNTFSIATPADLPSCSGDIIGRLYFIESTNDFRVCKSTTGWTVVALTTNPGITISSIRNIASSSTDFCTQYVSDLCLFSGGQILTYSDGSILLSYKWVFDYLVSGDSDVDILAETLFIPTSSTTASKAMYPKVARGTTGYRNVYIVLTKTPFKIEVWHDTNGDLAIVSGQDELLFTPTLTTL